MGRRVIELGFLPVPGVDGQLNLVTDLNPAFFDSGAMGGELGRRMLRVENLDYISARGRDRAAVADLPARFTVEGCFSREQIDFFAFDSFVFTGSIAVYGKNRRLSVKPIISDERALNCITNRNLVVNVELYDTRFP